MLTLRLWGFSRWVSHSWGSQIEKGPVTVPSCYLQRHKLPTSLSVRPLRIPLKQQRFTPRGCCCQGLAGALPLKDQHSIISHASAAMYGTECAKHPKASSSQTNTIKSHKLETRRLLKIPSSAGAALWRVWFQSATSSNGGPVTTYGCLHYRCICTVFACVN